MLMIARTRDCNDKRKPYVQVPVSRARLEITSQSNLYKKALKAQDFSLIWKQWTDSYSLLNYSFRFNSSTSTKLLIFCVLLSNHRGKDKRQINPMGFTCKAHSRITEWLEKNSEITEPHLCHLLNWVPHPVTMWMSTWTLPRMLNASRDVENLQGWVPQEPEREVKDFTGWPAYPQGRRSLIMEKMGHTLNSLCQNWCWSNTKEWVDTSMPKTKVARQAIPWNSSFPASSSQTWLWFQLQLLPPKLLLFK